MMMAMLVSDASSELLDDLDAFLRNVQDDVVDADVQLDLADCELDLNFAGCDSAGTEPLERFSVAATPTVAPTQTPQRAITTGSAVCQSPVPHAHSDAAAVVVVVDKTEREEHSRPVAQAVTKKKKKKRDQNRSRKRQREELQELRVTATQLQSQLEALLRGDSVVKAGCAVSSDSHSGGSHSGSHSDNGSHNGGATSPSTPDELALAVSQRTRVLHQALAWKRAAQTAKQTQERAVMENFRLRALIQENDVVCSSLRDACAKHCASRDASPVSLCQAPARSVATFDMSRFETLRAGLDEHCERLSAVWGDSIVPDPCKEIKGPSCLKRDGDSVFLERLQSCVLPFSPDAVKCAVWDVLRAGALTPTRGVLKVRARMGDTLYLTVDDTVSVPGFQDTTVKAWVAVKQFTTENRAVLAWQAFSVIDGAGTTTQARGHGWKVTQSLATALGKPASMHSVPCVWQACMRTCPEQNGRVLGESDLAPDSFVHQAVIQMHENVGNLRQTIENILMDASLRTTVAS